jgi:L-amino acid N-acyltransferase YncA
MIFKLVDSLNDALKVRALRNSCREFLTNYTSAIGVWQQVWWYWTFYRQASHSSKYRVYLFCDDDGLPIGYGAIQLTNEQLFVTECVDSYQRGKKYGARILEQIIGIANSEGRDLVAEIWLTNVASIAIHEKEGFSLESTRMQMGKELRTYRLATREARSEFQSRGE